MPMASVEPSATLTMPVLNGQLLRALVVALLGASLLVLGEGTATALSAQEEIDIDVDVDEAPRGEAQAEMLEEFRAFVDSISAPPEYVREILVYPDPENIEEEDPVVPPAFIMDEAAFPELQVVGILCHDSACEVSPSAIFIIEESERVILREGDEVGSHQIMEIVPDSVRVRRPVLGRYRDDWLPEG